MWFPATSGRGRLVVVVCGPSPFLAEGAGCGSPPLLARVRRLLWAVSWGLSRVVCVCVWCSHFCVFCVFVVSVLVVVWCGCVFRVSWCACVRVCCVSVVFCCLSSHL